MLVQWFIQRQAHRNLVCVKCSDTHFYLKEDLRNIWAVNYIYVNKFTSVFLAKEPLCMNKVQQLCHYHVCCSLCTTAIRVCVKMYKEVAVLFLGNYSEAVNHMVTHKVAEEERWNIRVCAVYVLSVGVLKWLCRKLHQVAIGCARRVPLFHWDWYRLWLMSSSHEHETIMQVPVYIRNFVCSNQFYNREFLLYYIVAPE